jgi:single-stranded DNA-binding protein
MLHCVEDNEARAVGLVDSEPALDHQLCGERFYAFFLKIFRLSETADSIRCTVSERLLLERPLRVGDRIGVSGQFRSYNNYNPEGSRLILTLFARELTEEPDAGWTNEIYLSGYLCKPPVYRTTPFGREIADLLLAVNRAYAKSDYIPCIAWGRNAKFVQTLEVGAKLRLWGRMQSREYNKQLSEEETVVKTAYEVSVSMLEVEN